MATVPAHLGVLQIEPTDHCNLACRMCAPHAEGWATVHGVPKGYLDEALYARVLDGLVADDCRFDHVILQWLGDPSLHPRLEALVARARTTLQGRVGYVRVDTNALRLTEPRMERLVASEAPTPLLLVFTLDAATPETYARVKGRDALPVVRRHVRHLLALRRHHPVHVQVQFVVQPDNAHEVGPFLRYWTDALQCHGRGGGYAEILFKPLSVGGGAAGQAAADALYLRAMAEVELVETAEFAVRAWSERPWQRDDGHAARGPCPGLWFTPVVRHDGELLLCCADLGSAMSLGNLGANGFRALWEGERATRLRLDHLDGRYPGPCATCGGVNWYALTEAHVDTTRARAVTLGLRTP